MMAENIARRDTFIDERRHIDPDQTVEARGLEQDVEDMKVARQIDLRSPRPLRPDDNGLRRPLQRPSINPETKWLLQKDVDDLMGSRRQRPRQLRRPQGATPLAEGAD